LCGKRRAFQSATKEVTQMPFVSCSTHATDLATKQDKLKGCDGADLPAGTKIPTCDELDAAVAAAPGKVTTIVETSGSKTWSYINEADTTKVLNNSQIVSANAGNAIAIGTDGGLMLSIPAQLPDDQVLSGDNTGTVALTLMPTTVNAGTDDEQVNYLIKADLKVAATTPDSETNLLKPSASGFYVDADEVITAIAGDTTALATLIGAIPLATTTVAGLNEEATGEETRLGATDANKDDRAVTPGSMSYALQTGKDYKIYTQSVNPSSNFGGANIISFVSGASSASVVAVRGLMTVVSGGADQNAVRGDIYGTINSTSFTSAGVYGTNSAIGTGNKYAVSGFSIGAGGTNIGVYGSAIGGTTNWAAYLEGNVASGPVTTLSDETLKEDIQPIDPAKALAFRNGLQQKSYEMFTEQQTEIVDEEGKPTGRYKVERNSQGFDFGYIAQDVKALTEQIGAFQSVVSVVGEYFTLDAEGYPVKDAQGNKIVNKRLGLNYSAMNIIIAAAEQYDSSVSMRQARLALHKFGLLDKVEAAVAGAEKAIQIDWEFAQSVNRNYGSVTTLAKAMGIKDKQLDELFALARTL
jgi:hypothetical protein